MQNSTAFQILNDFVSLIYPKCCVACGEAMIKGEELFCTSCLLELPKADLSEALQIPCFDDVVERVSKTETQTKKTKLKRWDNVSDVFTVVKPTLMVNKRVLLVDDVITTGATLESCAKVLLDNHCQSISIACIAAAQ